MLTENEIKENYLLVEEKVRKSCEKAGRKRAEVTLIAVSKMNPAEAVIFANNAGADTFGENKVQELCGKIEIIDRKLKWHLIGHLQTNKVKYVIGNVEMIHSVDSFKLAEVISNESIKRSTVTDILIEINIGNEESKFGVNPDDAEALIRQISVLPGVRVKGLMTVAPYTPNAEDNRLLFRKMRELSVDIASKNIDNVSMNVLSMGMTGDYEVAIEEGATHVRVGTGIFGARDYTK